MSDRADGQGEVDSFVGKRGKPDGSYSEGHLDHNGMWEIGIHAIDRSWR